MGGDVCVFGGGVVILNRPGSLIEETSRQRSEVNRIGDLVEREEQEYALRMVLSSCSRESRGEDG